MLSSSFVQCRQHFLLMLDNQNWIQWIIQNITPLVPLPSMEDFMRNPQGKIVPYKELVMGNKLSCNIAVASNIIML